MLRTNPLSCPDCCGVNVTPFKGPYAEGLPDITYQCKDCGREFLVTLPYTAANDRTMKKASKFKTPDS